MKILFIHVWNPEDSGYRGRFSRLLSYPSLTLPTLASLIPKDLNAQITLIDEMCQQVEYTKEKYDIIGLSFDTASSKQAYTHCRMFKQQGAYLLLGGYHVSSLPQEGLLHGDTVIIGAAENSLPQFLDDFLHRKPQRIYDDQNYQAAAINAPRRDLQNSNKSLAIPTIIADRGCDNRCQFCAISHMWRSNPRPIEQVISEIRSLNTNKLIFFDPNFFKPKEYALELMAELAKLNIRWAANATADTAFDDQLLQAARNSNCTGVLIGFESLSEDSLITVNKRYHQTQKYREIVQRMHNYNISVNGCFVLGFDHDTEEQLLELPEKIDYLELDLVRYAILTPLPGSQLFNELEASKRIISYDWSKYNQKEVVFQPKQMSPQRLKELADIIWKQSYSWSRVLKRAKNAHTTTLIEKSILLGANIGFKFNSN